MKTLKMFVCLLICSFINLNAYGALTEVNPTSSAWENYYQNTLNASTPWKTLLIANQLFQEEGRLGGHAADLGSGTGRDSLFLLKEGWQVLAIDSEQLAIDILLNRVAEPEFLDRLDVMAAPFSNMVLPDNLDLINASYSLPFCHPSEFSSCWENIASHLSAGGRFSGQFFGKEDAWSANSPEMTFLSEEDFQNLFKDQFIIEYLHIDKGIKPSAIGELKFWHVYNVVARKIK